MGYEGPSYEDAYSGMDGKNGDALVAMLPELMDSLNWPVWVHFEPEEDEDYPARLEVGFFSPRKGRSWILNADLDVTREHAVEAECIIRDWTLERVNNDMFRYS